MKIEQKAFNSYNSNNNVEPSDEKSYTHGFTCGYKEAQKDLNDKIKEYKKFLESKEEKMYHDYNDFSRVFYRKDVIDMLNYLMQM